MDAPDITASVPTSGGSSYSIRGTNPRSRPRRRGRGTQRDPPATAPQERVAPTVLQLAPTAPLPQLDSPNIPSNSETEARRGSRRGGRGGTRARVVGPGGRVFGSQLTVLSAPSAGLQADAPEFRPGQLIVQRRFILYSSQSIISADKGLITSTPAPRRMSKSSAPDIATRTHEDISNGLYDCPICVSEVLRNSKIWSCKTCYTVFHLQCIKRWSSREDGSAQQWRCPGCNLPQGDTPSTYLCWCGKETDPKPVPGLPPHSCHQTCGKHRAPRKCPHPCQLLCHAGPCPPCEHIGPMQSCFCGKETIAKRCVDTDYDNGWSCGKVCGDLMPCGEHTCERDCHEGLCGGCEILVNSRCYCGKIERPVPCSERGEERESCLLKAVPENGNSEIAKSAHNDELSESHSAIDSWTGSFQCGNVCNRTFDCGQHSCRRDCHEHEILAPHCPMSPEVVTHCPCGKTSLTTLNCHRESCQDPIPHCEQVCGRSLPCGHSCGRRCHSGECTPCLEVVSIKCRCGRTSSSTICHQGSEQPPQCTRVCKVLLSCGRHECSEKCCPGTFAAAERAKRKMKTPNAEDFESEHLCFRTCGRQLSCKDLQHICQELCHRGPCGTCREAIFEEIYCNCRKTVLLPPQPCGTLPPVCHHPCNRTKDCGHPQVSHQCHLDDSCPKCPYLVSKKCLCGKALLKNTPCWSTPSCSNTCQKKLKCGIHTCQKPCHRPGECEDSRSRSCTQQCGKRKTAPDCGHPCLEPCHAPYPCKEDSPCQAKLITTCDCQNLKQEVRCLATKSRETLPRRSLQCNDECLRLQRNKKLAVALNISADHMDDHIPYSSKTLEMYKDNPKWCQIQEREFRVFAAGEKEKRLRFKPMVSNQRAFLHSLAEDFGLDSESMDPEPYRHVAIFKTPRFVSSPMKTLAQCAQIKATAQLLPAPTTIIEDKIEAFNALLIISPRFALTTDELHAELQSDFSTVPNTIFNIFFLPSEEIVIYAAPSADQVKEKEFEPTLRRLKPLIAKTTSTHKLGTSVALCRIDHSLNVLRREYYETGTDSGWSQVVKGGASGTGHLKWQRPPVVGAKSLFMVLGTKTDTVTNTVAKERKERGKEKGKGKETVVEDWESAVDEWGD
jgi:transcriptional repressor NF-X1